MNKYLLLDKNRSGNKLCGDIVDCFDGYSYNIFYSEYSLSGQNFRNPAAWIIEISHDDLLMATLGCTPNISEDFSEVAKTY